MRNIVIGALKFSDTVATDVNLQDYMPLSGGTLTGDLSLKNANVNILSGRFSSGENTTAIGKSTFAYGDSVSAIGDNSYAIGKNSIAGCYGWYYDHIDFENNVFYLATVQPNTIYTSALTGEGTVDPEFESGFQPGDVVSYVNKAKFDMALKIVGVAGNRISVEPFKDTVQRKLDETTPNHDDWSIFCPEKPTAGGIWFGQTAYAEGLECNAINAYSHAEGRNNLAYGQYSHVEGYKNRAAYAAHAEGKGNYADGQYSHVEGWNTRAQEDCAHAEGNETSAYECAHAEGYKTLASGKYSHAGGNQTSAIGTGSHTFGKSAYASGYCSFAGGDSVSATNSEAFAIGWKTSASGQYSLAGGQNSKATANQAFAFGNSAEAKGGSALAHGYKTIADKDNTYCLGLNAKAKDTQSFVWSGIYSASDTKYESHGNGTFSINPNNDISGFYIGADNFIACVVKAFSGMTDDQKNAIKAALAIS